MDSLTEEQYWSNQVITDFQIPREKISEIIAFCGSETPFEFQRLYCYLDLTRFFPNNLGRNEWPVWCFIAFAGNEALAKKIPDFGTLRHNGMNALHFAVVGVNHWIQEYCIEQLKLDIKSCDDEGNNIVHFSAWIGSPLTCDSLCIIHGLNPLAKNKNDMTAFDIALQQKHVHFFKYFICNTNLNGFVEPLFSFIIERTDRELIKVFLQKHARYLKRNPLHVVIEKGSLALIVFLIEECGLDLKATNDGENALHVAAAVDKSGKIISMLMAFYGVDPEATTIHGTTPLACAEKAGNEAGVALLRDTEKCSALVKNSEWKKRVAEDFKLSVKKISEITQESGQFKHIFNFQRLHERLSLNELRRYIPINEHTPVWVFFMLTGEFSEEFRDLNHFGVTALDIAVFLGNVALVKTFRKEDVSRHTLELAIKGSSSELINYVIEECGVIPDEHSLTTAIISNNIELVIKFIVKFNINPRGVNSNPLQKNNALHVASMHGRVALMRWLMSDVHPLCNMDPAVENGEGYNALHLAAKHHREEAVKVLVGQYGMDPTVKTGYPSPFRERHTALELAKQKEPWASPESVEASCALLDDTKKCRGLVAEYGLRQIYKLLISTDVESAKKYLLDLENFFNALRNGTKREVIGLSLFNPGYTYSCNVEKCDILLERNTPTEAREYFIQAVELYTEEKCNDKDATSAEGKVCFRLKQMITGIATQPLGEFLAEPVLAPVSTAPRTAFYGTGSLVKAMNDANFDYENTAPDTRDSRLGSDL